MKNTALIAAVIFQFLFLKVSHADTAPDAVDIIVNTKPMYCPGIEIGNPDKDKKNAAEQLFKKQISALIKLNGVNEPSLIPMLVPYLNYNVNIYYSSISERRNPQIPDFKTLCAEWPAFAVIANMKSSSEALVKYIKQSQNLLENRVAAFNILRYVNEQKFKEIAPEVEVGLSGDNLRIVKGIVNGAPFDGIPPIH